MTVMRLPRLAPGQMPKAEQWNALCEMAERAFNLTSDTQSGIEVVRAGGGPIALRSTLVIPTPGITVTGFATDQFFCRTSPITGTNITEIDFGPEFANCSTGTNISGVNFFQVDIFDAGLNIAHGLVNAARQEFFGTKIFEAGLIGGTDSTDAIMLSCVPTIQASGSGYSVNDVLTFVGGSFSTAAQVQVLTVNGSGGVTSISIANVGSYTVVPGDPISVTGGTGTLATFNAGFSWIGNKPGAYVALSPTTPSVGSAVAPYVTWGDWTVRAYATAKAVSGKWTLLIENPAGGASNCQLQVQYGASGIANVIAVSDTAASQIGTFGVVDAGGTLQNGQTGTPSGAFTVIGGICQSLGTFGRGFDIVASNNLTGQTGAVASITSFAPVSATGTYRICGYVTITAVATDVLNLQVTYLDETATNRTVTLVAMGGSANLGATGVFVFPAISIRAKAGTAIVVKTILQTGGGSVTYDVGATIEQITP